MDARARLQTWLDQGGPSDASQWPEIAADIRALLVPTPRDQEVKVTMLVRQFITDKRITCAETIYQTDRVIEDAYEFIESLCDVVGYAEGDADG